MKTIVLRSSNNQFRVSLKVDLFDNAEAFTIMEIEGRSDAEVKAGVDLQNVESNLAAMKTYAEDNNLLMDIVDIDPQIPTENVVTISTDLNIITTGAMTAGNVSIPYGQKLQVEGGNGPLTFSVSTGSLPSGLVLDPNTGSISGTPDSVENPSFDITVVDEFGQTDTESGISINIAA